MSTTVWNSGSPRPVEQTEPGGVASHDSQPRNIWYEPLCWRARGGEAPVIQGFEEFVDEWCIDDKENARLNEYFT